MINQSIGDEINNLSNLIDYFNILFVSFLLIILIWITGKLLKAIVKQIRWIHPDARNLIFWIISIGQLMAYYPIVLGVFTSLGIPVEFILGVTAIIATAIAAASISIISNVIAGMYILITRPFRVGDLIRTQKTEGIVEEISLNYTRIVQIDRTCVMIPNSNLLFESLLNYNIKFPKKAKQAESDTMIKNGGRSVLISETIPSTIHALMGYEEIVRYRAKVELRLDMFSPTIPIKTVTERLDEVCDEFTTYFGFKPTYYFGKYDFRQELNLIITAPDGFTIFNSWPFFVEAITQSIYADLQNKEEER